MIRRQTSLSANIVQFCRFLRQQGFAAGIEEEALILQALLYIDHTDLAAFRLALKTILCRNKKQAEGFDLLFNEYWKQVGKAVDAKLKDGPAREKKSIARPAQFKALKAWLHGNRNNETEETAIYSTQENLSHKDFSSIPDEDVDELMQTIKALSKRLAAKTKRRYQFTQKINLPDLRQTLRKNLRRGGELLELAYRKPKQNRVKLVLLCDVSKSMELYTVFFIQFMYAFQQVYGKIETFTFSTTLKRVTPYLKEKNFHDALRLLGTENNNWEGGTRIGESLDSFVRDYSKKMLDSKTIVIILSDGWDIGDLEILKTNMELIRARSKKIVWLNPLTGFASYKPEVAGMQTAMPFIDVFAPAHNVESLRRVGKWL